MSSQNCQPDAAKPPYKGLEAYTEADAGLLFGRNDERKRLVYSLQSSRLTVVYGARQVGKSSLLRAGVVTQLREEAKRRHAGAAPEAAVVVFEDWSSPDTLRSLSEAINLELRRVGVSAGTLPDSGTDDFIERCGKWINSLGGPEGGELFLVLDHFDHHLMLCPECQTAPGSFDAELARLLATRGLAVNVMIAVRDELLAYLDRYRVTIPGLYGNLFRLEALSVRQAAEAIQSPVYLAHNQQYEDQKIGIEAELVEAVLNSVSLNQSAASADPGSSRYDSGGLQLAMRAVWDEERRQGSETLRHATFVKTLGGIHGIATRHIDAHFAAFDTRERALSARIFDHLLTPGGVGVAYQLADLATRIGVTRTELTQVIDKLKHEKMVMVSVSGESLGSVYYEMANRVLTPAMLERVQHYNAERTAKEKELAAAIDTSWRVFSEKSQADGLNQIVETCDEWIEGVKNLLADHKLQGELRGALGKMVDTLTQKGQFGGYQGAVCSVRFSRDGNFIVTGTEAGIVKTWNVGSAVRMDATSDQKHQTWIWELCASANGRWFASGSDDGTVALWTVTDTGVEFSRTIPFAGDAGGSALVRGLSFSADSSLLAISSSDGKVRLWSLPEERVVREWQAAACAVRSVEFAPDGLGIATGADDGTVGLWDHDGKPWLTDEERSRFKHDSAVWAVRFHPDGTRLASCGEDHRVRIWNLTTREEEQTLIGHTCWVLDLQYNSDGSLLASSSEDGTARVWDYRGNEVAVFVHGAPANGVCFSPDGQTVATAAADCKVRLWNVGRNRTRNSRRQYRHPGKAILLDVSFSCDGKWLATGGTDSQAQIWNEDGNIARALASHASWIMSVIFHPAIGTCLATGSIDGTARVWDIMDGSSKPFTPKDGPIWSVAFSPDGQLLATGSGGGKVCAWNIREPDRWSRLVLHRRARFGLECPLQPGRQMDCRGLPGRRHSDPGFDG